MTPSPEPAAVPLALGLDAGGTATRWCLVRAGGTVVAEGQVAGFSALELLGPGRERVADLLAELAGAVRAAGRPVRVHAGLTGYGGGEELRELVARPLGLAPEAVGLSSDLETLYLDLFDPGQGHVVYAGTGSVAVHIDAGGGVHRAGGRGVLIDDGGGGHWIAREALRQVWRAEDEHPGGWRTSALARELFARLGGPEWSRTRQAVYSGGRGDLARLAQAVAATADADPAAAAILEAAGRELARLARALMGRLGPLPVVASGGAVLMSPRIPEAMARALPPDLPFSVRACHGHHAAARLALAAAEGRPALPLHRIEP